MKPFLRKMKSYLFESCRLLGKKPSLSTIAGLCTYCRPWWQSLSPDASTVRDRQPWITFAAMSFLDEIVGGETSVYEFGAGGSTLFFSDRVQQVISAEHDIEWYGVMIAKLRTENINNCTLSLFEAEEESPTTIGGIADPDAYVSDDDRYRGRTFRRYASSIDRYPDGSFDVVFIDGRVRPSCAKHSIAKVKVGGYLVLDNSERPYYAWVHRTLDGLGWKRHQFEGPVPYQHHFSQTTVWQRVS